jgi:hypothetical protein
LNEHSDLINAQLVPLSDEINSLFETFNNISLDQSTFLPELIAWRQETHRMIDRFCERKQLEFEELFEKERNKQKKELDRLRNEINELIREQEATQENINSINDSIRILQQTIKQFQFPQFHISPFIIDQQLVNFQKNISTSKQLLPRPDPSRTVKLNNPYWSIAANDNYILVAQRGKLILLDRQLIVWREIPWNHNQLCDMFWCKKLAQFIILTPHDIFILDEKTMTVEQSTITCNKYGTEWWCGTCSNDTLFLSTDNKSSLIFEFNIRTSIDFVKQHRPPVSCEEDELITDLSSDNISLALVIINRQDEVHLDVCSLQTLKRRWSIQLGSRPEICRIRCCSLINKQWMMIDRNNSELFHISPDGKLVKKEKYKSTPWNAVQFDTNFVAILTKESVNLHDLF